jgi:hypothetical protein
MMSENMTIFVALVKLALAWTAVVAAVYVFAAVYERVQDRRASNVVNLAAYRYQKSKKSEAKTDETGISVTEHGA